MKTGLPAKRGRQPGKALWKDTDKDRAVAVFKAVGSVHKTAHITGIPESTVKVWMTKDWWEEKVKQLRTEDTAQLEQAYTDIAKASQEVVKDRLAHGDFVLNKDGQLIRKPVSLRDATLASAISVDKRKILAEEPQREQELGVSERLIKLVEQFARFSNAKQVSGIVEKEQEKEVIDVEPIEDGGNTDTPSA